MADITPTRVSCRIRRPNSRSADYVDYATPRRKRKMDSVVSPGTTIGSEAMDSPLSEKAHESDDSKPAKSEHPASVKKGAKSESVSAPQLSSHRTELPVGPTTSTSVTPNRKLEKSLVGIDCRTKSGGGGKLVEFRLASSDNKLSENEQGTDVIRKRGVALRGKKAVAGAFFKTKRKSKSTDMYSSKIERSLIQLKNGKLSGGRPRVLIVNASSGQSRMRNRGIRGKRKTRHEAFCRKMRKNTAGAAIPKAVDFKTKAWKQCDKKTRALNLRTHVAMKRADALPVPGSLPRSTTRSTTTTTRSTTISKSRTECLQQLENPAEPGDEKPESCSEMLNIFESFLLRKNWRYSTSPEEHVGPRVPSMWTSAGDFESIYLSALKKILKSSETIGEDSKTSLREPQLDSNVQQSPNSAYSPEVSDAIPGPSRQQTGKGQRSECSDKYHTKCDHGIGRNLPACRNAVSSSRKEGAEVLDRASGDTDQSGSEIVKSGNDKKPRQSKSGKLGQRKTRELRTTYESNRDRPGKRTIKRSVRLDGYYDSSMIMMDLDLELQDDDDEEETTMLNAIRKSELSNKKRSAGCGNSWTERKKNRVDSSLERPENNLDDNNNNNNNNDNNNNSNNLQVSSHVTSDELVKIEFEIRSMLDGIVRAVVDKEPHKFSGTRRLVRKDNRSMMTSDGKLLMYADEQNPKSTEPDADSMNKMNNIQSGHSASRAEEHIISEESAKNDYTVKERGKQFLSVVMCKELKTSSPATCSRTAVWSGISRDDSSVKIKEVHREEFRECDFESSREHTAKEALIVGGEHKVVRSGEVHKTGKEDEDVEKIDNDNDNALKYPSCGICGASFMSSRYLDVHCSRHVGDSRYSCRICQRVYNSRSSLVRHGLTHTDEKPFGCGSCSHSQDFTRPDALFWPHEKRTCTGENATPYHCDQCGLIVSSMKLLCNHINLHNSAAIDSVYYYFSYSCSTCDQYFKDVEAYINHKMICDNFLECPVCSSKYDSSVDAVLFLRHVARHAGLTGHPFMKDILPAPARSRGSRELLKPPSDVAKEPAMDPNKNCCDEVVRKLNFTEPEPEEVSTNRRSTDDITPACELGGVVHMEPDLPSCELHATTNSEVSLENLRESTPTSNFGDVDNLVSVDPTVFRPDDSYYDSKKKFPNVSGIVTHVKIYSVVRPQTTSALSGLNSQNLNISSSTTQDMLPQHEPMSVATSVCTDSDSTKNVVTSEKLARCTDSSRGMPTANTKIVGTPVCGTENVTKDSVSYPQVKEHSDRGIHSNSKQEATSHFLDETACKDSILSDHSYCLNHSPLESLRRAPVNTHGSSPDRGENTRPKDTPHHGLSLTSSGMIESASTSVDTSAAATNSGLAEAVGMTSTSACVQYLPRTGISGSHGSDINAVQSSAQSLPEHSPYRFLIKDGIVYQSVGRYSMNVEEEQQARVDTQEQSIVRDIKTFTQSTGKPPSRRIPRMRQRRGRRMNGSSKPKPVRNSIHKAPLSNNNSRIPRDIAKSSTLEFDTEVTSEVVQEYKEENSQNELILDFEVMSDTASPVSDTVGSKAQKVNLTPSTFVGRSTSPQCSNEGRDIGTESPSRLAAEANNQDVDLVDGERSTSPGSSPVAEILMEQDISPQRNDVDFDTCSLTVESFFGRTTSVKSPDIVSVKSETLSPAESMKGKFADFLQKAKLRLKNVPKKSTTEGSANARVKAEPDDCGSVLLDPPTERFIKLEPVDDEVLSQTPPERRYNVEGKSARPGPGMSPVRSPAKRYFRAGPNSPYSKHSSVCTKTGKKDYSGREGENGTIKIETKIRETSRVRMDDGTDTAWIRQDQFSPNVSPPERFVQLNNEMLERPVSGTSDLIARARALLSTSKFNVLKRTGAEKNLPLPNGRDSSGAMESRGDGKSHRCTVCHHTSQNRRDMLDHLKEIHASNVFTTQTRNYATTGTSRPSGSFDTDSAQGLSSHLSRKHESFGQCDEVFDSHSLDKLDCHSRTRKLETQLSNRVQLKQRKLHRQSALGTRRRKRRKGQCRKLDLDLDMYSCDFCSLTFSTATTLYDHVQESHPIQKLTDDACKINSSPKRSQQNLINEFRSSRGGRRAKTKAGMRAFIDKQERKLTRGQKFRKTAETEERVDYVGQNKNMESQDSRLTSGHGNREGSLMVLDEETAQRIAMGLRPPLKKRELEVAKR